jgi:acyl-coenzyme A synthetase/AMP-(fatty) acid ligase
MGTSLKAVLTCGEPLTYELVSLVRQKVGPLTQIMNLYGPTECTMTTTIFRVESDISGKRGTVPIGLPRSGTFIHLLREDDDEVAHGEIGEICIGGLGLTDGYLNRPDLMRQRFMRWSSPFLSRGVLFRTGDFGRWSENGSLIFEGRADDQVKIRGERIEIGEIEAAIAELGEVGVVVMSEGAYAFVANSGSTRPADIKKSALELCRSRLSPVAQPREVFSIDAIPHTPSGKVDRKSLRNEVLSWRSRQTFAPPASSLEKEIAMLWREVLATDQFGIDTEFLAAGGDSMQAANIANRLSNITNLEIPSYLVIEAMTIRNLAAIIASVDGT